MAGTADFLTAVVWATLLPDTFRGTLATLFFIFFSWASLRRLLSAACLLICSRAVWESSWPADDVNTRNSASHGLGDVDDGGGFPFVPSLEDTLDLSTDCFPVCFVISDRDWSPPDTDLFLDNAGTSGKDCKPLGVELVDHPFSLLIFCSISRVTGFSGRHVNLVLTTLASSVDSDPLCP